MSGLTKTAAEGLPTSSDQGSLWGKYLSRCKHMRISEPAIERKEDGGQPVIFDDESEYDAAMFEFFKSNRKQTAVSDLGMQEGESRINPLADFLRVAGSHIKRLFGRT